jgi:translation initiation factor IF-2
MSNETVRINKVVKEFNIGISTLVEFLKKKGFEVEASPNAKISAEEYALARKEFVKELTLKEESKKVILKVKEKPETVSIDDIKEKKKEIDKEEIEVEEVIIKTTQVERPTTKIIGKINLDSPLKKETGTTAPSTVQENKEMQDTTPAATATTDTAVGTKAESITGTKAEPVAGTIAEPIAGTKAEPVAGAVAEPVAGTKAEPVA